MLVISNIAKFVAGIGPPLNWTNFRRFIRAIYALPRLSDDFDTRIAFAMRLDQAEKTAGIAGVEADAAMRRRASKTFNRTSAVNGKPTEIKN